MKSILFAVIIFSQFISQAHAQKRPQGGDFVVELPAEPTTLNPITASDGYSNSVHGYILESLLSKNVDTYDWEPSIAEKWEISKDKKTFTFKIKENLKWSDGKPLTVEDVKFSLEPVKNPKYKALAKMPYYEGIAGVEIVDARTVKFTATTEYFMNFDVVAGLEILPQHIYKDPNAKVNKTVTGSGPYMMDTYEKGRRIILKKNPLWWGVEEAKKKGENNFDRIVFRFVESPNVKLEMLKKGDIDFMDMTAHPDQFVKNTSGPEWGKTLIKVKTKNEGSKSFNWIGLNLKNPILKDQKVRLALAHLVNRDLMIEKFKYGLAEKVAGPGLLAEYTSSSLKPILFDPKKALDILKEAGWVDSDKDGVLDKVIDGKKTNLELQILIATDIWTKYLTVMKEDAKKVGVLINIKNVEWNTFSKVLKEGNFDAVAMAWGGGSVEWDPKQIWHSTSNKGGSNYINYNNPEVDKLIDEARNTWDRKKRAEKLKKVNDLIAADVPYIFLFTPSYTLYAHRSKIQKEKDTYKYGIGSGYWWMQK